MQFYSAEPRRVLEALAQNRADPFAVRRACAELSRFLLAQPASARATMGADSELLATLVAAAEVHADADALVLVDCCRFLRRTIDLRAPSELDVQSRITKTGVLKLLARGLQRHSHSAPLFAEVCRLAVLLCFDMPFAPHADNQADARDAGLLREIYVCLRSEAAAISAEKAQLGVDAIAAILYENESNADEALERLHVLALLSSLLERLPHAPACFVQSVTQTLFQILTLQPALARALPLHQRAVTTPALHYVGCMLLCRLAVSESTNEPPEFANEWGDSVPHKARVDTLAQSGAPELALSVLKCSTGEGDGGAAVAQALRLLELLAAIDANRIPLTRLGASRAVKLIYNGAETSAALRVLCERAVAAVEGT
ncbi:hypothetical protein PybrP1_007989 [[Pythium] brassicae (nom. inval.)]|nr:hypothetical protein PybrP1_007989 [[Pythium] brassicae (nom. inval.)]